MPRIARFAIASISELSRQLRYAPPATRAKQMDAAEDFAADVEADQLYPEDFIIYRITGYRPQLENPALLVGEALIGDLATFIQLLSDALALPPDYRGRVALPLEQVAHRLNVASKTVQRYRRKGLICHYIRFGKDDQRLACFEDALARFVNGHKQQIEKAGDFSRVEDSIAQAIITEARSLQQGSRSTTLRVVIRDAERRATGLSLNEAASILAKKHNRAHETIRMILRRHDRQSADPIFIGRGPLTERDGRILHRAARWGVPIALMADRFGRTATSIHRAINRRRGTLLRDLNLRYIDLPTFQRADSAEVILSARSACEGLDRLLPPDDALALLTAAKKSKSEKEAEVALHAAYNFLKRRAACAVTQFDPFPGAAELDAVETDLRWAGRIKRRLVSLGLPVALSRIEQHLGRPMPEQPADRIIAAIQSAVCIVADVVETLDLSKGQQFSRIVAYASDRALARDDRLVNLPGRASARHSGGRVPMNDPFLNLHAWDRFLEPRPGMRESLHRLADERTRNLLRERYGWDGLAPRTVAQLAQNAEITPTVMARTLNAAETELLTILRKTTAEGSEGGKTPAA